MIDLGRWNDLVIVRFTDHGAYLDGGRTGEILMPPIHVDIQLRTGDTGHGFVYLQQE